MRSEEVADGCVFGSSAFVRFFDSHDVQLPTCQIRCQTHVLTATTNSKSKLIFGDNHVNRVFVFVNHDTADFGRRQRVHHELGSFRRPQHHINALACQFVADGIHTGAAHADTGALRIDALVVGFDRHFRTLARIARHFADFQQAVCNFRYFHFVQLRKEITRSTAEDDLFAAGVADFVHTQKQRADTVAAAEVFTRNHLFARNQRVELARNDFDDDAVAFYAFYRTGNDVFFNSQEFVQILLALGIADALQDDLFGSLRGLAAKAFVRQRFFVVVADLNVGTRNFFLDFFDGFFQVGIGVILVGNNQPAAVSMIFAGIAVNFDAHVHMLAVGFFLGCGRKGEFQCLEHHFRFNVFLACQRFGKLQHFATHFLESPISSFKI